jgi:hypothetical protein
MVLDSSEDILNVGGLVIVLDDIDVLTDLVHQRVVRVYKVLDVGFHPCHLIGLTRIRHDRRRGRATVDDQVYPLQQMTPTRGTVETVEFVHASNDRSIDHLAYHWVPVEQDVQIRSATVEPAEAVENLSWGVRGLGRTQDPEVEACLAANGFD